MKLTRFTREWRALEAKLPMHQLCLLLFPWLPVCFYLCSDPVLSRFCVEGVFCCVVCAPTYLFCLSCFVCVFAVKACLATLCCFLLVIWGVWALLTWLCLGL